jgi:hypothetical protein
MSLVFLPSPFILAITCNSRACGGGYKKTVDREEYSRKELRAPQQTAEACSWSSLLQTANIGSETLTSSDVANANFDSR